MRPRDFSTGYLLPDRDHSGSGQGIGLKPVLAICELPKGITLVLGQCKRGDEPLQYGQTYHIYTRGNNRENLFFEARNYRHFLRLYGRYIEPVADTFAYCLLRNHLHLLVYVKTVEEQEATYQQTQTRRVSIEPAGFAPLGSSRE